jgi:GDP-4-dehydro-6-deoxy-D-mannose reductase
MRQCLEGLLSLSNVPLQIKVDERLLYPNDIPVQVGSFSRLNRHTGWYPKISLTQSLADLLEEWRQKTKHQTIQYDSKNRLAR